MVDDREPAQDDVAEEMAPEMPHRSHHPAHAERRADFLGLAGAIRAGADHLLQRDDVGVQFANHFGDARRHRPAVHAAAAMDVVGRDPDVDVALGAPGFAHCCRSRIQTNGPTIFSQPGLRRQRSSVISSLSAMSRS